MTYIKGTWRKKPIVVHVEQFVLGENMPDCLYYHVAENTSDRSTGYYIDTAEGPMPVKDRAIVVTGVEGEHWAIQESIFLKTYEHVP